MASAQTQGRVTSLKCDACVGGHLWCSGPVLVGDCGVWSVTRASSLNAFSACPLELLRPLHPTLRSPSATCRRVQALQASSSVLQRSGRTIRDTHTLSCGL